MKKIFSILLVVLMTISLNSCKGFLDQYPTDEVVDKDALTTIEDAGVAVNGMYTLLKYYTVYGSNMIMMGDMRADLLYPRLVSGTGSIVYTYEYEPSQNSYFSMWNYYYKILNRTNSVIKNIDALEVPSNKEAVKNDYLGQAYALRALCFFDLARLYGKPYLYDNGASLGAAIIKTPVAPSESHVERSTVAATYGQVLEDLGVALPLLSTEKNKGHMNYWAAKFLQAKVYLYMGRYGDALTAIEDVIDHSPYFLVPNSEYLASWSVEGNSESIFEGLVNMQSSIDGDNGFGGGFYYYLWFGTSNTGASVIPTKQWRDLFENTPNDIRKNWIAYDDPVTGYKKTGEYWLRKFTGNEGLTAFLNNPRIMRLAEAYLIASEAALEERNQTKADHYLLQVVQRADPTVSAVTATLDRIREERAKELIGEGDRFFDLMRRGGTYRRDNTDPHEYNSEVLTWDNDKVALPISHSERVIYPELQQNPGYKN
ncbi:MAG: RagB/SusD family nutrient uptake outer membrane protein [Candidatus Egerieousia sp.]